MRIEAPCSAHGAFVVGMGGGAVIGVESQRSLVNLIVEFSFRVYSHCMILPFRSSEELLRIGFSSGQKRTDLLECCL